jgi:hypothetical protein
MGILSCWIVERKREAGREEGTNTYIGEEQAKTRMRGKGECKAGRTSSAGQWAGVEAGRGRARQTNLT